MDQARDGLERLRAIRPTDPRGAAEVGVSVRGVARAIERLRASTGSIERAWVQVVPADLRAGCGGPEVLGKSGAVTVRVKAGSSAARFRLQRWLDGGGLALLRGAAKRAIGRVRVV